MKAKFTGHDTFPLRYGWLFKAINHIDNNGLLASDGDHVKDAISKLGVGKNMINAIKYWAESCQVISLHIEDRKSKQKVTDIGRYIFDVNNGKDPYLEDIGSLWLIHFLLNFDDEYLTSYRYFFNYSNSVYFEKTRLIDEIGQNVLRLVSSDTFKLATIKKDVDCFLSTYSRQNLRSSKSRSKLIDEDYFTSPLSELGLIVDLERGYYQSDYDDRPTLPIQIFIYALVCFFNRQSSTSSSTAISFEDILTKPLSPGRIFRLSESALGHLLDQAVEYTSSDISWVDSLGLKQVTISNVLLERSLDDLDDYYGAHK